VDLLARGEVTSYAIGTRPAFDAKHAVTTGTIAASVTDGATH